MADDLGDEWWLDGGAREVVEVSNDQDQRDLSTKDKAQKRQGGRKRGLVGVKDVHEEGLQQHTQKNMNKRKHNKDAPSADNEGTEPKKRKKRKKKTLSEHLAATAEKPGTLDDLQVSMATYFHEKLSVVEMEELIMDAQDFVDHNAGSESISEYLGRISPDWAEMAEEDKSKKTANKSCTMLVLTSSAKRAVDLNRDASTFKGTCVTAKLFAKHMKMNEQEKFLASHRVQFAVGTPHRVSCLLNAGAFTLDDTRTVILDWNWRDAKLRKFVDIPELKKDLFDLLRKYIVPAANRGQLKIGLF